MAQEFFDAAVEKAKAAFDIAKKKTEEAVAVSKQKFDVATLENKLDRLYKKLGKAYYEMATNNVNSQKETETLIAEISEKREEIKFAKEQTAEILNKKVCTICNAYNDKKAGYCSSCGAQMK